VKHKEVILTSDYWRIIVNFDLTAYEDATTILREDLSRVEEIVKLTTPIGEMRHVKTALNSLENKLGDLKQFLLKVDRRRGLINAGGSILKVLFGTATVMDLEGLHTTIDVMQKKEDAIVHSLNQQVTYLKQLDGTVKFNYEAIANLSTTLKGIALKAQEGFQEVATKLTRNNQLIETAAAIQQMEFALTQLEISNDEFVDAMQYVHLGRIPLNLVSPTTLRELLKNVTLVLPGGYEFIVGLCPNNVYLYYVVIQATMLADAHSFKLVLNVPLKTVNRQHELYKMVVLPTRI
jgi:hypothetical protein